MNAIDTKSKLQALADRSRDWRRRTRSTRRRLALFLAVLGPGLITSNVDNDAGGISTYSVAGAKYGYALLWALIPMTIALYVTEEMCARLGVVTGKGLSDLIREEFGFRPTFFVMVFGFLVDLANVVAEFAGIAAAMEIFHVTRYVAVPIAGLVVWILVLRGTYRQVEKIFLVLCSFYFAYIFAAILAKPNWIVATKSLIIPSAQFNVPYLLMLTALIGTTIAPWQFFYMQASFVEKRVGARQYKEARMDVLIGSITCMVIVFFVIVACAATLWVTGHRNITAAAEAAQGLRPLAGKYAASLFAFGLLNASLFAACILPLSTAHVICEGLGFEAGIDHKFRQAPEFYGLYTVLIVIGGGLILIPGAPLLKILVFSQVANGIWLPIVLIFMVLLANRRDLLGEYVNSKTFNAIAWITSVAMIFLTIVLVVAAIFPSRFGGVPGI